MKKYKKKIILGIVVFLLIVVAFLVFYNIFRDKNSLNVMERTWLNNNSSSVVSVNITNNLNIFSINGDGVFYDFLNDIKEEYDLEINANVINDSALTKFGFNKSFDITNEDLLFFTDNYVLVSKNNEAIADLDNIVDKTIGILSSDMNEISKYYVFSGNTISNFETSVELFDAMSSDKVNYVIVPLNEYKDAILGNNYFVVKHLNDLKVYYYFTKGDNKTLNSIFNKFYNNWKINKLDNSYYKHDYNLFIKSLGITELEEDTLTNKDYVVGVLEDFPYQIVKSGKIRGINKIYLDEFQKFSNVDFEYKKYNSYKKLTSAIIDGKANLAFNSYQNNSKIYTIDTNLYLDFVLISPISNNYFYDNIESVKETVYVLENSKLYDYLKNSSVKVETYKNYKDLKKLIKKGKTILLDKLTYEYYVNTFSDNYSIKLTNQVSLNANSYLYSSSDTFSKLFSRYIMTLNNIKLEEKGLVDFEDAYMSATKIGALAKYILILLIVLVLAIIYFIRKSKKIVLNTKIKKDEKLKFIDMLTSLKNRNYLNDKMEVWNQNTIYPQAVIVIDLNNIKYLNDTFGHEEGDKQIQGAANVLFKIQPDNSEIIRTDGNEFMVYMVGYPEAQVIGFIKKLLKEFKKLPYEYSAAIGFSMIVDDLKLVEDAINEASEKMRENKANMVENSEEN